MCLGIAYAYLDTWVDDIGLHEWPVKYSPLACCSFITKIKQASRCIIRWRLLVHGKCCCVLHLGAIFNSWREFLLQKLNPRGYKLNHLNRFETWQTIQQQSEWTLHIATTYFWQQRNPPRNPPWYTQGSDKRVQDNRRKLFFWHMCA